MMNRMLRCAASVSSLCLAIGWANVVAATCTVPNQLTNGQVADATQVMGNINAIASCVDAHDPAGSENSVQINSGGATFGSVGPLADGQLVVGVTNGTPQPSNITAGPGVIITNSPGNITISTVGASGASYSPPSTTDFGWANQPTGATMASVPGALQIKAPALGSGRNLALLQTATPTTPYTRWMRLSFSPPNLQNYFQAGIAVSDVSGKVIALSIATNNGYTLEVTYYPSATSSSPSFPLTIAAQSTVPLIGVNDDGTNINFLVSYDGVSSFTVWSASRTAFLLSGPISIGPFVNAYSVPVTMNVAHWSGSLPGPL